MSSAYGASEVPTCTFPSCRRPIWQDPMGGHSAYCGKAHRDAMAHTIPPPPLCKQCRKRPAYVENGRTHDFCGQRCRSDARQGAAPSARAPSVSSTLAVCAIPGCGREVYVGAGSVPGRWCSDRHRREAVHSRQAEACLLCRDLPKAMVNGKESDFCSKACGDDAISVAPIIFEIPEHHKAFENVRTQFVSTWRHPTAVPTVRKIWKIYGEKSLNDAYGAYKRTIERKYGNASFVNVKRRFHGTARSCRLGDDLRNKELCSQQACSLCNIIRSSFQLACFGKTTNFGRFGEGIYTSATSSKANDYVKTFGGSSTRAILLSQVVMGRAVKLMSDDTTLTEPPNGADSVIGEPGGVLNYDEAIVYNNDAIRPTFLIIYD